MKKKIFITAIIIDLLLFVISLIYNFYLFILLFIINILSTVFVLKKYNIMLINFPFIYNIFKSHKIRSLLSQDEYYLKKIKIDTFDKSGELTHPYVLFFKAGFKGYKYWMVYTPYKNNNIEVENPCIAVSNDGYNFEAFSGMKSPLLPIIKKEKRPYKYYSDPFLLFNDGYLELWYRYTIEDKELYNEIYRIRTKDGINWSNPELMFENNGCWYLSPSIVKKDNHYYFYYFDKDLKCYYQLSNNLVNWHSKKQIKVEGFNGSFWHGEVKLIDDRLFFLFLSNDYKLFLCDSNTEKMDYFSNLMELNTYYFDNAFISGKSIKYKSSILIDDNIKLYIPFRVDTINLFSLKYIVHKKWTITYTCLSNKQIQSLLVERKKTKSNV